MTKTEWATFNKNFETGVRRKRGISHGKFLSLACPGCKTLLSPSCFADDQARKAFSGGRKCITCYIKKSNYSDHFTIGGKQYFGCVLCERARPVAKEHENRFARDERLHVRHCKSCFKRLYRFA